MNDLTAALVTYWWSVPQIEKRGEFLLSQLLKEHGINVDVITTRLIERNEEKYQYHKGINVYRYERFSPYKLIPLAIKKLISKKYCLIHGFSYGSAPADMALFVSKLRNIPFVFTPFGSWHDETRAYIKKIYDNFIGKFILKNSSVVISKSNFEKLFYKKLGITNVITIPEVIETKIFSNRVVKHDLRESYSSDNIVLSVGMLNPRKRHEISIKIFKKVCKEIPDAKLIIIGGEIDTVGYANRLLRLINKLNLEDNVILTGYLPRDQVIDALLTSKVFLLPTRYESFGIVFIEAMAAGLPVVTIDKPPLNEIIRHGKSGYLIPEKKFNTLSDVIIELLSDSSTATKFGMYGKRIVEKKYNLAVFKRKMWNIYEKLIFNKLKRI